MKSLARLLPIALLASTSSAGVLTVDDDGGPGVFLSIQDAVLAAAAGDVILVEGGSYGPFDVTKRLSILGRSTAGDVHVSGISRVGAVTSIRLAGLRLDALELTGVNGPAVVEDCRIGAVTGFGPTASPDVTGVLLVVDCQDVLVSRSVLRGAHGCCGDSPWPSGQFFGAGSAGLRAENSNVVVVDSEVYGGAGEDGCFWNTGGSGVEVRGGEVLVVGSLLFGGGGGSFQCCLLYTSPSPRDQRGSRMPSSA